MYKNSWLLDEEQLQESERPAPMSAPPPVALISSLNPASAILSWFVGLSHFLTLEVAVSLLDQLPGL